MNDFVHLGVIERVADLPRDVLQIPDGKSIFAAERGSYGVALNVFGAGQKLAFFIPTP